MYKGERGETVCMIGHSPDDRAEADEAGDETGGGRTSPAAGGGHAVNMRDSPRGEGLPWLTLREDEAVLWVGRPHIYPVLHRIFIPLLIALGTVCTIRRYDLAAGGIPFSAAVVLISVCIVIAAWVWVKRSMITYVVTDTEMYERRGVFSETVTHIHLNRIQNTQYRQSVFGRLIGYGSVSVYTAGTSIRELNYNCISDPSTVDAIISRQLDEGTNADAALA